MGVGRILWVGSHNYNLDLGGAQVMGGVELDGNNNNMRGHEEA